ncbi:MAG: cytochrome-c peroxidase [Anaerolineales bacterium]
MKPTGFAPRPSGFLSAIWVLVATLPAAPAADSSVEQLKLPSDPANYAPLARYEPMKIPEDNPLTVEKATLGWQLFFDPRLSGDGKLSCYSCHLNDKGLTDGRPVAIGAFEKKLTRASPTLWNIGYQQEWYWDGRAKTLEGQALAAWKGANMGGKDAVKDEIRADIIAALNAVQGYREQFRRVFKEEANEKNVSKALATYMRTIVSGSTPFDRWQEGDEKAVSEAAKRGFKAFEKAKCTNCHSGVLLTDQQFHNVGIGMKAEKPDVGRFTVTKVEKDTGAFKTPTLRDITDSAPYFHDGSVATLEEAVKQMLAGGIDNPHLDRANIQKASLTDEEVKDLLELLKALDEPTTLKQPKLP